MTEYEIFMEMVNRVYIQDIKKNTHWFSFEEDKTKEGISVLIENDSDNYFYFHFDEEGKLIDIC